MQNYIWQGQKKLRRGYTTGTCAAAASGAAVHFLLTGEMLTEIPVLLPGGERLSIPVAESIRDADHTVCTVVKDSGDDPDVTNGIKVCASVRRGEKGITITGGEGIGIVTKPGLDQPVGNHAINSVPRRMIAQAAAAAAEALGEPADFDIEIFVPGGVELAGKTYNPRMGIEGGISIIGTSGIVEPMSTAALVDTIRAEANMRRAAGETILLLTLGNYGEQFLGRHLSHLSGRDVRCSNYLGDAIDIGISLGFSGILIIGHIGKLVKLGSGIFNTHSSVADGRMETLMACGVLAGADPAVLQKLPDCATADAALDLLDEAGCMEQTLAVLTKRISTYLNMRVKGQIPIGAAIFSYQRPIWLVTETGAALLEQLRNL